MVKVKICGIRSIEEALAVAAAGADAMGFHIELEHSKSPISALDAGRIIAELPQSVLPVLVTTIKDVMTIAELVDTAGVKAVQLQGEIPIEAIRVLKNMRPDLRLFKAVHIVGDGAIRDAKRYEGLVDAVLLDSKDLETGALGGTGKTHDWNISRQIVKEISVQVILAGGLNADNVADAIATVQPFMVDVNSGVSNLDGTKDPEKVKAFIKNAKVV